jgi:hypothetical protein
MGVNIYAADVFRRTSAVFFSAKMVILILVVVVSRPFDGAVRRALLK